MEKQTDIEREQIDKLENYENLRFEAYRRFNEFLKAVEDDRGLVDTCKDVYKLLDSVVFDEEKDQFIKTLKEGKKVYRARIIMPSDFSDSSTGLGYDKEVKFSGYNEVNSCEPFIGKGNSGRNNIAGMPYLYVASNEATACAEVKPQFGEYISLAEFKVKKDMNIVDFSSKKSFEVIYSKLYNMSLAVFFTQLMMQYSAPVKDSNGYRATQIISEYIRKTGLDGIGYQSYLCPGGINYTIFHSHHSLIEFQRSSIFKTTYRKK